jgi:hypothetical protein
MTEDRRRVPHFRDDEYLLETMKDCLSVVPKSERAAALYRLTVLGGTVASIGRGLIVRTSHAEVLVSQVAGRNHWADDRDVLLCDNDGLTRSRECNMGRRGYAHQH